jgi:hypothetical protein
MPANRAAHLELVPHLQLSDEVRRHFPVVETLDGQRDPTLFRRRGYRVAALSLISIFGGEPDVDMLAGEVSRPHWDVEVEARDSRCFLNELYELAQLPP